MKKRNSVFTALLLGCCFLFNQLGGMFVIPLAAVVPYVISKMINDVKRSYEQAQEVQQTYERRIRDKSVTLGAITAQKIVMSELGDTINQRIDGIINEAVRVNGKDYPLFPTLNSKIFVLKNIQDFFYFKYPELNQFVYAECVKKIRDLQKNLTLEKRKEKVFVGDKEFEVKNQYYVDQNQDFKAIDAARDEYMIVYGLSSRDLKYMEDLGKQNKEQLNTMLSKKIEAVKNGLIERISNAANAGRAADASPYGSSTQQSLSKTGSFDENNPVYKAHISILAHLIYWQSQNKPEMFIEEGQEILEKAGIVTAKENAVKDLRQEYSVQLPKSITVLPANQEAVRNLLARQYAMELSRQPIEEAQAKQRIEEDKAQVMAGRAQVLGGLRTNEPMSVPQPRRSVWSTIKSWFGW